MYLKPKEKLKKKWKLTFNKNPEETTKFRPNFAKNIRRFPIHVQSINYFLNPLSDFRFLLSSKSSSEFPFYFQKVRSIWQNPAGFHYSMTIFETWQKVKIYHMSPINCGMSLLYYLYHSSEIGDLCLMKCYSECFKMCHTFGIWKPM